MKYAPKDAPLIGHGRWTWPLHAINDDCLLEEIANKGLAAQREIEKEINRPLNERNLSPQTIWNDFKTELQRTTKRAYKSEKCRTDAKIKSLEKDIKSITNRRGMEENKQSREELVFLESEHKHIHKANAKNQKNTTRAQIAHHGERPGGIWATINSEKKPRDLIPRLKIPNATPLQYERSTKRMAELARKYHDDLQEANTHAEEEIVHENEIRKALDAIPDTQKLQEANQSALAQQVKYEHVEKALHLTKNGSATGLDGCPYKLWKALHQKHQANQQLRKLSFDIIKMLALVFQDIQQNEMQENADFASGWMCPIYKKKDHTEICNYRPITLLNTDYKILTKVLALQLMEDTNTMIHPDQSGFVPG